MVAGFEHLELSMIDYTTPYIMGNISTNGVENSTVEDVVIFPNPASDQLNIKLKEGKFNWEINDLSGNKLMLGYSENKSTLLDVSNLKPGMYMVNINSGKSVLPTITKLIKE
jgi:hypothetical protein